MYHAPSERQMEIGKVFRIAKLCRPVLAILSVMPREDMGQLAQSETPQYRKTRDLRLPITPLSAQ